MANNDYIKRGTGVLLVEVISSNPNGDPDRDGEPRTRYNGFGEITPVSVKRKIRDLVSDKDNVFWKEISAELGISESDECHYDIIEERGRDLKEIKSMSAEDILDRYWDCRVFGTTTLGKAEDGDSTIRTGVVQFGLGTSLSPVNVERMTTTGKAGVEEGKDRSLAPLAYRIVSYGVYAIPFFINATAAANSKCTKKDIDLLLKLIPYIYSENLSYVRSQCNIRHAYYVQHKTARGRYSDFSIIEKLTLARIGDNSEPAEKWSDYNTKQLEENIKDLNKSLTGKAENVIDLIEY